MKPNFRQGLFALVVLLICGCAGADGPMGPWGTPYLTIKQTDGHLYSYSDDVVGRPNPYNIGDTYQVSPGEYNFNYESRIYVTGGYYYQKWIGSFAIWKVMGSKGGKGKSFWRKGDAGAPGPDSYLTLTCNYDGVTGVRIHKELSATPSVTDEDVCTVTIEDGGYAIMATFRRGESGKVGRVK